MVPETGKAVLKFSATWCGPCKMQQAIFERAENVGAPVVNIDIDEHMDLAQRWGVRGVPTIVLVENGVEKKRKVGILMAGDIESFVNE